MCVIKDSVEKYKDYEFWCLTSTGKDSSVCLDIVQKVIPDIPVMFNNTTLDCSDTYKMVKKHPDWIVTTPKEGFYQYVRRINFIPTRFARGCCSIFKEKESVNWFDSQNKEKLVQIMGIRNLESSKRANRDYISKNPKWGNRDWIVLSPIRKWDDFDVWLYILDNNLEINPKYKKGYTRVGCAIACPYYTKTTWVLDEYWYNGLYRRWHNILDKDFLEHQRWTNMNCTQEEYHKYWCGGVARPEPTEEVIREMMEYKGISDYNVAKNFFNKTCYECGKNIRQKDVLAMNMKLLGRNTTRFYCKKCFMKNMNMSQEQWDEYIRYFKADGCALF